MDEAENAGTAGQLSDAALAENYPGVLPLVQVLEDVAARDPSENLARMAGALATYFRTGE